MTIILRKATAAALAAGMLSMAAITGHAVEKGAFGAETFTLDNGLQVVVVPNHRAPLVHHAIWFKVGAADEPPGKSGVAHFLEHLMFKGTEANPDGAFSRIVARHGGTENAFTSQDYTGYFQNIAVDRLEMVMRLEADRMVNLSFDNTDFENERNVVLEERRSRVDNHPGAVLAEQTAAALYLNHPYGLPVIGWEHEIQALTPADIMSFYRAHYAPDNALLVVTGDITAAELKPMAAAIYGPLEPRSAPARMRLTDPPQRAARRLAMSDPRVTDRQWSRSYVAPSYSVDPDNIGIALSVFSRVLGSGALSRLYQALVVEKQIAVNAGASFTGLARDSGRFVIHVSPKEGVPITEIEAAVNAEISRLFEHGVGEEELERTKFRLRAFAVYSRDSLSTLGRIFGSTLATGLTVDQVERWPREVAAVTAEQVIAAGRAVLVPERSVTALLMPEDSAERIQ